MLTTVTSSSLLIPCNLAVDPQLQRLRLRQPRGLLAPCAMAISQARPSSTQSMTLVPSPSLKPTHLLLLTVFVNDITSLPNL